MRKILTVIGLAATVVGCQKNLNHVVFEPVELNSSTPVITDSLRHLLANLVSIDFNRVGYDPNSQQLTIDGKGEIGIKSIETFYLKSPKIITAGIKTPIKMNPYIPIDDPDCPGCNTGGGSTPPPYTPPLPPYIAPFADPADTILSYNNTLINYHTTSATRDVYALNTTDITKGSIIGNYSLQTYGSGAGSISGSNVYVRYNQSQTLRVTVTISIPHEDVGNVKKILPFRVNAALMQFTGNRLTPSAIPNSAMSVSEKDFKSTDYTATKTFTVSLPAATASLNGVHLSLYWNNATSGADEKIPTDPVYTINVQGLPENGQAVTEQQGPVIDLYRLFYSPGGEHFYTASAVERHGLIYNYNNINAGPLAFLKNLFSTNHTWLPEGTIGKVYSYKAQNTVALYRLFNGSDHMYTIDRNERDNITANLGYTNEGIVGYVYSTPQPGTYTVYRYRGTSSAGHFLTTSLNEIGNGNGYGFAYEGVAFYTLQ